MNEYIEKLSSYNLFNYLFPGVVFCLIVDKYFSYSLIQESTIIGIFLYYFIGLVISRIGSLIIEPILKKTKFVNFSSYSDYIAACKQDSKIEILSEENNMYRTVVSLLFTLVLVFGYESIANTWPLIAQYTKYIAILILIIMFLFSYKKQTSYIVKRIESSKEGIN